MENRMQQGREVCIPMFLPVNLALRMTQAAGTYSRLLSHLLAGLQPQRTLELLIAQFANCVGAWDGQLL